jgi:hypothetical protein
MNLRLVLPPSPVRQQGQTHTMGVGWTYPSVRPRLVIRSTFVRRAVAAPEVVAVPEVPLELCR